MAPTGEQRVEHELAEVGRPALMGVLQVAGAVNEERPLSRPPCRPRASAGGK